MNINTIPWFLRHASYFPRRSFSAANLKLTLLVLNSLVREKHFSKRLMCDEINSCNSHFLAERGEYIGFFVWPYLSSHYNIAERYKLLTTHFDIIKQFNNNLDLKIDEELTLASLDLNDQSQLRITLDRPKWFIKEGQLVINLIVNDLRAYSIALTLNKDENDDLICYIGAIQGRNIENIMTVYRILTKSMHGMRPRDFLIEYTKIFCTQIGVKSILAISDNFRHHRHPYFNKQSFEVDYNQVWSDRGGFLSKDNIFYEIPTSEIRRPLEEIKSKKRAMYRKRYHLLDQLKIDINNLNTLPKTKINKDYT